MRGLWTAFLLAFCTALSAQAAPAAAPAASSGWDRKPEAEARLVSAVSGAGELQELPLGLQIRLKPGWKTYWRSPGEGGYPPRLDWSGSENLAGAELQWPAPTRFAILGVDSVGYQDEVVLPLAVRPQTPGEPVRLRLALDYLTCEAICIPQSAELALTVPAGPAEPTAFAHLIDRFRGRVPGPPAPGLAAERAELTEGARGPALRLAVATDRPLAKPDVFVESDAGLVFGPPTMRAAADGRSVSLDLPVAGDGPESLVGRAVTLTLVDGGRAVEQTLSVSRGVPAAHGAGLLAAIAVALLGGLVLNAMPCVLPVLSIKLLGLIGHGGAAPAATRRSFLATAAGIVASFLLLAGAAIGVKAAGMAVGWGIQFQHPWFLAGMTVLLLLFAANLWGLFEIRMPGWAGALAARGGDARSLGGAFFTGTLATLLATPCSAPFVGTAIGFALARGPAEILAIFTALGVGLASPYLAIAAAPRLVTRLPRPGRWMIVLRRLLGVLLIATAVWLLAVLQAQAGLAAAALVAAAGAAILALLWTGRGSVAPRRWGAVALLAAFALAAPALFRSVQPLAAAAEAHWTPFDRARIAALVEQGQTVFVDVTADWCITCQVNKAAVLQREPVAGRLAAAPVVAMRADWTRPDEAIGAYLASFGRYGIPFNAVYGPGAPAGIALPELLSSDGVLDALDRAAGHRAPAPTS